MKTATRTFFYLTLFLALTCAVIGAVAWTATSSPAMGLSIMSTPTRALPFGYAQISKPTYTPAPTAIPTAIPTSIVQAEIVQDTSAADFQPPPNYSGNKYILVDISEQHMYVYEGDSLVYSFVVSTGIHNGTRAGNFSVLEKIPNAYGATWDIWMPNWLGIYWSGGLQNGIHALPILPNGATLWSGYLGTPISYGCVVLGTYESELLYNWAEVGTPVEIQR
jgi:lipoprotein-anchoring transpeptidase ErfK/SrfK